jgi:hypothetical protein
VSQKYVTKIVWYILIQLSSLNNSMSMVSGVQVSGFKKKPDRLKSYQVGKLEGLKARKLPGFLASKPPSLQAMSLELSAMSYFA